MQELDVVSVHRKRRGAEFARRVFDARLRRKNRPPRFRLPIVVDDVDTQRFRGPARRRLVERLAGEEQIL